MPYTLNTNKERQYVHLIYTGCVNFEERQKAKNDVFAMCFDKNLHRTLVDLTASDIKMSESEVIKFASSFKDTKLPKNYRLAGVIGPDNQADSLIEIIISLDGIDVKYFSNFDEAEEWLTAV